MALAWAGITVPVIFSNLDSICIPIQIPIPIGLYLKSNKKSSSLNVEGVNETAEGKKNTTLTEGNDSL